MVRPDKYKLPNSHLQGEGGAEQDHEEPSPAGSRIRATFRLAGLFRLINDSYMINQSNTTKAVP